MGKYYIDYNTGTGNEWVEGTLDEAKKTADEGAAYTGCGITITDEDGNNVAGRKWWGVEYDSDEHEDSDPIQFGQAGFYGDWQDE